MTKDEVAALRGDFTWDFGGEFFIETDEGNFVWSAPEYQGDGSIRRISMTYKEWIDPSNDGFYGRAKGEHYIGDYCGDFTYKGDSNH